MTKALVNISSLVTMATGGKPFKAGSDMSDIGEIKDAVMIFSDKVVWTGSRSDFEKIKDGYGISETIDAGGKAVLPGFVDSHTHIVFGGDRSSEFGKRLRGYTYAQIAGEGGGIQTTVRATRAASEDDLAARGRELALSAMRHGTTTIEIKSGYSLTTEGELKQLAAIRRLREELPMEVVPTFMGAHDFPPELAGDKEKYIDILCGEMIPAVKEQGIAEYCDIFIDKGYYDNTQARRIFDAADAARLKLKAHCDELADVGAAQFASDAGAHSCDHLLFANDKAIETLARNGTVAGLLPGTAYFIRLPYAPARRMIDAGAIVALATDCNPGSCFTENMQAILSLAVINMHMTAEEALAAATINGAHSLRRSAAKGSLEPGKDADFIIMATPSYLDIFYHFGINHVEAVWVRGQLGYRQGSL